MTDLGNAERFRERASGRLLWNGRSWSWWGDTGWTVNGAKLQLQLILHEIVRAIQDEADAIAETHPNLAEALRRWGCRSEAFSRMAAIPKNAAPYMVLRFGGLTP
jgi:hypothetical protein